MDSGEFQRDAVYSIVFEPRGILGVFSDEIQDVSVVFRDFWRFQRNQFSEGFQDLAKR